LKHTRDTPKLARAAVVHLDLDGGSHIFAMHGWRWTEREDTLAATGLLAALAFFDRACIRATLFVIAEGLADPQQRELLQEAVRRGHEVASHSLSHRKLGGLQRDDKRREIFESRDRIAAALGVEPRGFRAPGFDIDRETFELLDEAGYLYDSSLFATPHRGSQMDGGAGTYPPIPGRRLLELPLPAYRPLPTPAHPSYSLVLGTWYFRAGLWAARRTGAPLVLLFHLTDFAAPLPAMLRPSWRAAVFTLSHLSQTQKIESCQHMLDLVRKTYTVTSTARLLGFQCDCFVRPLRPGFKAG
jgi:peptidoglycan/xylan/chitin deacetylase (PgdA/CDA1 family)